MKKYNFESITPEQGEEKIQELLTVGYEEIVKNLNGSIPNRAFLIIAGDDPEEEGKFNAIYMKVGTVNQIASLIHKVIASDRDAFQSIARAVESL